MIGKSSIIVPLLKPGKCPSSVKSYRQVALTSCLAKIFERIMNNRLHWHLNKFELFPPVQPGFRPGFCTADHIIRLETYVKQSFGEGLNTYAICLDIENAYGEIWLPALLFRIATNVFTAELTAIYKALGILYAFDYEVI